MPKYADLVRNAADLSTDFGLDWAKKLFGEEAVASLPVRASGKNKGRPKGFVVWRKASVAGYCREVCSPLAAGQLADAWIGAGHYTHRGDALRGMWLGRVQPLAASAPAGYFFESGRAAHAAGETTRKAADDAAFEAERAAAADADGTGEAVEFQARPGSGI